MPRIPVSPSMTLPYLLAANQVPNPPGGALKPPTNSTRTSTYAATVLRDYISLADFGADRTGVSDAAPSLRRAIAEAQAITAPGFNASKSATVHVPAGRYLLGSKVQIPEATTIVGDGYSQTSFYIPSSFPDNAVFEPLAVDGTQEFIGLQGFILYGASSGGTVPSVSQANGGVATTVNTSVTTGNQYLSFSLVANGDISAYASSGTLNVGSRPIRVRYQSVNVATKTFLGCVVVNGLGTAINAGDTITAVTTDNISGVSCVGLAGPTYLRDLWISTFTGEPLLIANCNAADVQNIVANYSNRDCILYTGARASNYFRAIAGQYSGVSNVGNRTAGFHLQGQNGLQEFAGLLSLDGFYSEQTSDNACGIWLDNYGSFSGQSINLQGGVPVNPGTQTAIYISATQASPLTQDGSHSANISLRNIHCGVTGRVLLNDTVRNRVTPANTNDPGTAMTRYDTEDSSPGVTRPWVASNLYWAGQLVSQGNAIYQRNSTGVSTSTFATDATNWTLLTPAASLITATNVSWPIPAGATLLHVVLVGGGGGGAGAGSSSAISNQAGASGGASGQYIEQVVSVGANTTLNVVVAAAGGGGAGGAAGGSVGVDGTAGGASTVNGTGISLRAEGGGRGLHSAANSSTTVNGLLWGAGGGATSANNGAGGGGPANSTNGLPGGDSQGWVATAGQGGAPTSATNGGVGGASPGFGSNVVSTSAGTAPGTAGTNGSSAPANSGGGGGGGGGGAWNGGTGPGAGGNGGAGGTGFVVIRVIG